MFIICKNDFPFLVCPSDTHHFLAQKIVKYLQDKCGPQLGLASPTHYHLQEVPVISQEYIEQIKLENENGSEETNHTEVPEIDSKCQAPESTKGEGSDGSTG